MRGSQLWLIVLLAGLLPVSVTTAADRELWLYYSTNLQVNDNIGKLDAVWRRAAKAGYTHILLSDSKMARLNDLGSMRDVYYGNVKRVRQIADELKLTIIPAVFPIGYSNSMLWHDPNLAEGLPVRDSLFVVKAGKGVLSADPPVNFAAKPDWKDDGVLLAGQMATVKDNKGNARMVWKLNVAPFRCYHIAVQIKTDNYAGRPEIKALVGSQALCYANLGAKPTQDWTDHHIVFNSLENKQVNIYFGTWGDARGTLQWRNWRIEESPLVNILRRDGAPLVVRQVDSADKTVKDLVEGKDFDKLVDPRLGSVPWKGEYQSWHEPPVLKTSLPDGTRLRISWFHPAIIHDGQVMICPSEPTTAQLLADEARLVKEAFAAKGFMMSHDEIRTLNWDESCQERKLSAGAILAENVRACTKMLAGSTVYVWSDMFDPTHNAHDRYYLVNGDLAGSWEGLDRDVVIVNWNFGKRDESLKFFAGRGHRQVIAGYYDGPVARAKDWLASAGKVEGVVGIMYTTWRQKYDDMEEFAMACRGTAE